MLCRFAYELIRVQKLQLTENSSEIFEDTQQNKRTGLMIEKIWKTGSTDQRHQNTRLMHADTVENRPAVDELADLVNDKCQKQTHHLTH